MNKCLKTSCNMVGVGIKSDHKCMAAFVVAKNATV
jgi:hypothetical protein